MDLSQMPKIRVLHIITRLIVGGAQENTMLTASFLDKNRYEVEVWSGPQTGSEGSLKKEYRKREIKLEFIPELVREINPVKDFLALFKIIRKLKRQPFDIIHTHSSKAGILGRIASKLAGVPVIVHTVHGWSFHDRMRTMERKVYIALEKWTEHFTDKLITVTDLDIKKGLDAGIFKSDKYVTIHSGIEIERYRDIEVDIRKKRQELGIKEDAIIVGTVARLSPQKAPLDFVEMVAQVHQDHPDVKFVYVGDGPLRDIVENRIRKHHLEDAISLLGLRCDVPELLHCIDIFALSSHWEGLPRVFPQAMAAGKPIVATRVDGASEAIQHGVNGFLVETGDVKGLSHYVGLLIGDKHLRNVMGRKGLDMVDPAFSARDMVSQISVVYEELLNGIH
jgi:glycosyltransferase involved in cell wall biosynthesis